MGPSRRSDLAGHVGDGPALVDENRSRLLDSIGIGALRSELTTAEQIHGTVVAEVTRENSGSGAFVAGGAGSVPGADALWTRERGIPLLLVFADCVPVVLVRPSVPAVAVVHAGWRGAAAGVVESAAAVLGALPGPDDMEAFVGPTSAGVVTRSGPTVCRISITRLLRLPRLRPSWTWGRPSRTRSSDQESRKGASGTWVSAPHTTRIAFIRIAPKARRDGTARSRSSSDPSRSSHTRVHGHIRGVRVQR